MATYTRLQIGNKLPTVAILQLLLNSYLKGKEVSVDGYFGSKTRKAVMQFQKLRGIRPIGIVGRQTWSKLNEYFGFRIIDCLDVTEDRAVLMDWHGNLKSKPENAYKLFERLGVNLIKVGMTPEGLTTVVNEIIGRSGNPITFVLLRFFGHGESGWQGISHGTGDNILYSDEYTGIWDKKLHKQKAILQKLNPHFGVYTSIELHGCNVAQGNRGELFLQNLVKIWGVPVSAAKPVQYWGEYESSTFKFEGRTASRFPNAKNLKTWSAGLPRLPKV